jgi:hypothetical protein
MGTMGKRLPESKEGLQLVVILVACNHTFVYLMSNIPLPVAAKSLQMRQISRGATPRYDRPHALCGVKKDHGMWQTRNNGRR